jgi:hypothetical protein
MGYYGILHGMSNMEGDGARPRAKVPKLPVDLYQMENS